MLGIDMNGAICDAFIHIPADLLDIATGIGMFDVVSLIEALVGTGHGVNAQCRSFKLL